MCIQTGNKRVEVKTVAVRSEEPRIAPGNIMKSSGDIRGVCVAEVFLREESDHRFPACGCFLNEIRAVQRVEQCTAQVGPVVLSQMGSRSGPCIEFKEERLPGLFLQNKIKAPETCIAESLDKGTHGRRNIGTIDETYNAARACGRWKDLLFQCKESRKGFASYRHNVEHRGNTAHELLNRK